jgi:hypothetical protein
MHKKFMKYSGVLHWPTPGIRDKIAPKSTEAFHSPLSKPLDGKEGNLAMSVTTRILGEEPPLIASLIPPKP